MHNNTWATVYLISAPAGLALLAGLLQWVTSRKFPKKTIILTVILALIPLSFIIWHSSSEKKEMSKRQGIYIVIQSGNIQELCSNSNADSLQLTLFKSGTYSFNNKPCFADRQSGKWKWQDDMVGNYAVFDIKINNDAYLHFDENDTLRLIREGKNYLSFTKKEIEK